MQVIKPQAARSTGIPSILPVKRQFPVQKGEAFSIKWFVPAFGARLSGPWDKTILPGHARQAPQGKHGSAYPVDYLNRPKVSNRVNCAKSVHGSLVFVIPAHAGIQRDLYGSPPSRGRRIHLSWVPAFAGTTNSLVIPAHAGIPRDLFWTAVLKTGE